MAQTPTAINTTLPGAYLGQENDAEAAYQQALQNISTQQAQLMQQTGFTGDINPTTGALTNEHIDANDQYSQVMGLLGSHASNMKSLREGLLGRGLGATGLSAQQQALLKFTQAGETSNLGSQFSSSLNDLYKQGQDALTTRNSAFTSAEQNALNYQIQQQLFDAINSNTAVKNTNGAGFAPQPNGTVPGQSVDSLSKQGVQITPNTPVTAPNPGAGKGNVSSGIAGLGGGAGGVYVPPGKNASTLAKNFAQPISGYAAGSTSNLH